MPAPTLAQPMEPHDGADRAFRHSAHAIVSWRTGQEPIWRRGRLRGFAEKMGAPSPGTATLDREAISVEVSARPYGRWGYLELKAMQTSSSSLQISLPGDRLVQLRFTDDSPKRWEDLLQCLIREAYQRAGRGFVAEFQPRIAAK